MDEILYLKYQKGLNSAKGLKSNFLFFFLLVLGGYFRILDSDGTTKLHNGVYNYNGLITYNTKEGFIDPFIYIIKSEFSPDQYQKILDVLNPAGMLPITFLQRQKTISSSLTGEDINSIFAKPDIYVGIYLDDTVVGMIQPFDLSEYEQLSDTASSFDLEMQDNTKWDKVVTADTGYSPQTGAINSIFYSIVFNTTHFTGSFNRIKVLSAPTPTGNYSYNYITTEGEVLYDEYLSDETGTSFDVVDNTEIGMMVEF